MNATAVIEMPPFIVLALPRSRTYWLSRFLSYGDWHCGHDELQHMRSLDDVQTWFTQPNVGTVETAAAPFWRLLRRYQPGIRIVTVRRSVADVLASVTRAVPDFGVSLSARQRAETPNCEPVTIARLLRAADRKLDQVEARIPDVLSVRFDDLAHESTCAQVFEHCLPYPHDRDWWASWNVQQVSGNLTAQIRYAQAFLPQLQKLARAAKHRILADMAPITQPPEGFTFQDEPFDHWYRDAVPLFREHMAQTGQDIDDWARKNIPLGRRLDDAGAMQIITARSNGRMFGYLMAVISPTLDDPNALMAQHMPVFASPDCPGLGMKLQRASIEALRRKGVTEVVGRAGTLGSGPRLGIAYRRLGFEEAGQLYHLDLAKAH
jgi:hypothetical protein